MSSTDPVEIYGALCIDLVDDFSDTVVVDKPTTFDFSSVHSSLSHIVTSALDYDPSLIPISCKGKFKISAIVQEIKSIAVTSDDSASSDSEKSDTVAFTGSTETAEDDSPRDPDDFVFESEAQAVRMSKAIREAFDVELTPEVIIADANLTALANRILTTRDLLSD
jgi:phosphatidylethanolamine N-methyltransferase